MAGQVPLEKDALTRAEIELQLERAREAFTGSPDSETARYAYANLLYQSGVFWQAWEIAKPFAEGAPAHEASVGAAGGIAGKTAGSLSEGTGLAARLAFLLAKYETAERLYKAVAAGATDDDAARVRALLGLMFTWCEQDDFTSIRALEFPGGVQFPLHQAIKQFRGEPYQLRWSREDRVSVVPFVMTDPLPLLMAELNGVPTALFFDTGADTLIVDSDVARAFGVEATATGKGPFGGGLVADFGYGQVESLMLADVELRNVPIMILPVKRLSGVYQDRGVILGGAVGTAMLRQFLATLDYKRGRMVLRERSAAGKQKLDAALAGKSTVEVPFVLDYTHLMMVRGSLHGKAGLTAFVDSGLAMEDCKFTVPPHTLSYLGIPEPERTYVHPVGGGGGSW